MRRSGTEARHPAHTLIRKFGPVKLVLTEYGVLQRFCGAQTHNGFRLDLDRFARLGVAANARLAMRLHDAPYIRDNELARAALGFLDRQLEELVEELARHFLWRANFVGHVCDDLGLAEWFCHLVSLSSSELRLQMCPPASKPASRARRALYGRSPSQRKQKRKKTPI